MLIKKILLFLHPKIKAILNVIENIYEFAIINHAITIYMQNIVSTYFIHGHALDLVDQAKYLGVNIT